MARAWTFQEGLLSRRLLFFSDNQDYFECGRMACCETLFVPATNTLSIWPLQSGELDEWKFYPVMLLKLLQEYNKRSIGDDTDILNGLRGFLQMLQRAESPFFSIWGIPIGVGYSMNGFLIQLSWELLGSGHRRDVFPSWSWAAWQGPASFGALDELSFINKGSPSSNVTVSF
jgi:hypothetical protein